SGHRVRRGAHEMVATRNAYQKALDKARAMGGTRLIVSVAGTVYTVRGSVAPATYAVALGGDSELHCDCSAGMRDIPCYHAAAVWLRRLGEQAAGLLARTSAPTQGPDSAPMQQRSGLGVGMVGRWTDEDGRSLL